MPSYHAKLTADLDANTSGFKKGMADAQRSLKSVDRQVSTLSRNLGLLLTAGAAGGLVSSLKRVVESADNIGKTADKIGLTTDALQELQFAAERSGVAVPQLNTAMQRFSRRIGEAAQGQGVLVKVLDQYGIKVRDADGRTRSLEAILADYADAMRSATTDQERLRIAVAAFDTEGAGMVNMLRDGAAGMDRLREAARDAGVVLDEDLIRAAERLNDQWDTLLAGMTTRFQTFVLTITTGWQEIIERFRYGTSLSESLAITPELAAIDAQITNARLALDKINARRRGGDPLDSVRQQKVINDLLAEREKILKRLVGVPRGDGALPDVPEPCKKCVKAKTAAIEAYRDEWDAVLDIYEAEEEANERRWAEAQAGIAKTTQNLGALKQATEDVQKQTNQLDWAFQSAFESAIFQGEKLGDVLKALAKDIATVFIRQSITAPLASAAGGFLSSLFGGFFGSGGVAPANKLSVVGEDGPEFLMPARDTAVIPAGAMGGVSVTNNWDFSGANPATVQLLRQEASRIVEASKAGVLQAIEQGGTYARSVGRRT